MPHYKSYDLVHVTAMIIPAGSIVDGNHMWSGVIVYGSGGQDEIEQMYEDYLDEADGVFEVFTPPDKWLYKHTVDENHWFKALRDCVVLDIEAFGDGFGSVSCGIDFEISNNSLLDTFHIDKNHSEFKDIADLAKAKLDKYRKSPAYRYRRQYHSSEPIQPLDIEESQVHLVLVYSYTSVIDDYNNECDVYIEYVGQLNMDALNNALVKEENGTPQPDPVN